MRSNAGWLIAGFLLLAGGCSENGGDAPIAPGGAATEGGPTPPGNPGNGGGPPAPGNPGTGGGGFTSWLDGCGGDGGSVGRIWVGEVHAGENERIRLLVAETGEFRWLPGDGWFQQVFGTFQADGTNLNSTDAVWVWVEGLTFLETRFESVELWSELSEQGDLTVQYLVDSTASLTGTYSLAACDSLYLRGSSQAVLAGEYTGLKDDYSLAIDGRGFIFYQNSRTGCVGSGTAELIDSEFNMYRGTIELENCTAQLAAELNGLTFTGLGYLGDSGDGAISDIVEFAFSAEQGSRNILWNPVARR